MLSAAVVVFREVFEIVLILGIVIAATRDVPRRGFAIGLGVAGGLAGAALIAVFTDAISNFAQGVGQEYFNAAVLFAAAGFIGWTVLWMKRHAREIKAKFTQVGQDVIDGKLPRFALSAVIALAIWREGSEIVLFVYGMLASGQSGASLLTGCGLGLAAGLMIGGALYAGLIKLSLKIFFQVTSWLLVILVAGMASQATGFLVAAGAFNHFTGVVWDSSWLLSEGNIFGKSVSALTGYTARPTEIQLFVYLLTLGTFIMLMNFDLRKFFKPGAAAACIALVALFPAQAHATKKVYSPYVEKGELELESRTGYDIDDNDDVDGAWAEKLGVGYGVNEFWSTEVEAEIEKEGDSGEDPEFAEIEWENKFQLTQPGEYWADVGALIEYAHNTQGGPDSIEGKLLLAKDTGSFTHMANLGVERDFGEDAEDETEYSLAWGTRYRYSEAFEPGFELHSDFGSFEDDEDTFDEQDHQLGPVAYGKLGALKYDGGVLFGISDEASDATLKLNLEYEFPIR